jgi:hypothetical protein
VGKAGDPGGPRALMQYLKSSYYPVNAPYDFQDRWIGKVSSKLTIKLKEQHTTKSLRKLAKEYGVSHETVRRIIKRD